MGTGAATGISGPRLLRRMPLIRRYRTAANNRGSTPALTGAVGAVGAVGAANGANPLPIVLPCHRVIGAGGALTGYAGGLARKRRLLALEGCLPG